MNIDNWIKEVDQHAQPNIQIIVIANKSDLVEVAKLKTESSMESSADKLGKSDHEEKIPER